MPNLGPTELIIILVIILAIFGAGKLSGLGGALGKGVRDFRAAVKEESDKGKEDEAKKESVAKAGEDAQPAEDDSPAETAKEA